MRAGDVIRALRTLARRSEPQPTEFDLDNTIEEVLTLARSEIRRHDITLHNTLETGSRPVSGDRVQLQQVLLNLIVNSIEAIGFGMGLAIYQSIINAHGGRIWFSPRIPHGTIFRFFVPGTDRMEHP